VTYPVTLTPGGPAAAVTGQLCAPHGIPGQVVEVAEPGATYGPAYWTFPGFGGWYDYAAAANRAGYAVLALSRPGTSGDYPPASDITMAADAWVLHQVIGDVRHAGARKVITVGHSLGSYAAIMEAGTWHDVDGLIVTAALHTTNPVQRGIVAGSQYQAPGRPAGYLTTRRGTRETDFYNPAFAQPAVVAEDEATKTTVTGGELAGISTVAGDVSLSRAVTVPVLLAVGTDDSINCDAALPCSSPQAVVQREAADWSPAAHLQAFVLPLSGHDINLAPDAPLWFAAADRWVAGMAR
jgi:pimeloyl-ACP methyl ester carboxylesterase